MKSKISHIEINVLNYRESIQFYDQTLVPIGFQRTNCCKDWTAYSDGQSKIIVCPTEDKFKKEGFHRKRAGINHFAFAANSKEDVDHFYKEVLIPNSIPVLYGGKPFGDEEYYAVFFEGPDRIKLEYVYAPHYFNLEEWPSNLPDDFDPYAVEPDHTAVRVALWRALHVQVDSAPHVFNDDVGMKLVDDKNWRQRPDMDPHFSKPMRASIVGRSRFIEDLLTEKIERSQITQYVILGAGLDSFAQRKLENHTQLHVFEIDKPETQAWKKHRLKELGYKPSPRLHFVSSDFESSESWWKQLAAAGFDIHQPAVVVSAGVSMYLSPQANKEALQVLSKLAPNSTFAMTFLLSLELLSAEEQSLMNVVMAKAKEAGTPFLSLFRPESLTHCAKEAGFQSTQIISAEDLYLKYFAQRPDHLSAGNAEGFLIANT